MQDLGTLAPVGVSFVVLLGCALVVSVADLHLQGASSLESGLLFGVILGPVVGPMLARWTKDDELVERQDQTLYLEGKMKRYSLLFSVNGGAFAIAKLLSEPKLPGGLGLASLSFGAIVFTVLMTADIWLWGAGMRKEHGAKLFRPVGQTILLMIGALLCSGWILVRGSGG
jgi:hypothetical protein